VFPEEAMATAMMDAVARPSFGDCWAAYVLESANPAYHETGESHHVKAAPLGQVGDQVEVIGIEGTIVQDGTTYDDHRRAAFMRVGRAVVIIDPPYVPSVTDEALVQMLTLAAGRLTEIQDLS
jgi:hypothetical protein